MILDHPRSTSRNRGALIRLVTCLLTLAAIGLEGRSEAALILDLIVQDSTAAAGSTGSFDVILVNDPSSDQDVSIGSFNLSLQLASTAYVRFTSITTVTAQPYIFELTGSFMGAETTTSDGEVTIIDFAASGGQILTPGGTAYGLAHVTYLVAAGAPRGSVAVTLQDIGGLTALGDDLGDPVTEFTPANGLIFITNASVVPEPSGAILMGLGALALFGARARKSREQ